MKRDYNKKLTPRAQELRRNATPQENHLWYDFLSGFPYRFLRQRTFGHYIVDFYCHEAQLVIELDGSPHFTPEAFEYDSQRTAYLESLGLQVIRFTDREVDTQFESVCLMIENAVMHRLYPDFTDLLP